MDNKTTEQKKKEEIKTWPGTLKRKNITRTRKGKSAVGFQGERTNRTGQEVRRV